jgi:hypothetical protein
MILQEFLDRAAALKRKSVGAVVASLSYHVRAMASSLARQRIDFARQRIKHPQYTGWRLRRSGRPIA